ncbi:MAG: SDR family oxidoreductase [Pseudomonadota bacterium]
MQTALVTGTSTGIGLAAALRLARAGYRVFAGMRTPSKGDALRDAAAAEALPLEVIAMDVTDADSTATAFDTIRASAGPVDVLVNNAGIGGATPFELTPLQEHRDLFETNYFGLVRCIQAVLPEMRERGAGTIVNLSSVEGRLAIPNQVPYSASKWAVECLTEALAHEVTRFGVRVVAVEPGVIMTNIFDNSADKTRFDKTSPYRDIMRRNGKMFAAGFRQGTPPEAVADTILEAIRSTTYKLRWPVGGDAFGMLEGRATMSDETWVGMGEELSDAEYNEQFERYFGITL